MGRFGFRIRSRLLHKEIPVYVYMYDPGGRRYECKTGFFVVGIDWVGEKQCGKTSTASNAERIVLYLQDPDRSISCLALIYTKPSLIQKGETPRLIDEWQMAPVLRDATRFEADQRGEQGQFILTGSVVPIDLATAHTGIGRITRFKMRPMSLFESNESYGTVSLKALFDGSAK